MLHDLYARSNAVSQPRFSGRLYETDHVTSLTLVRLFDISDISDVISRMLVMQTKMNMSGGPRMGEICRRVLLVCQSRLFHVRNAAPLLQYPAICVSVCCLRYSPT